MENPFDILEKRLINIERMISELQRPEKVSEPEPQDRIGLNEALKVTGLSKSSIYKLTHERKIPFEKYGIKLVFSRRQLAEWVEENTISPDAEVSGMMDRLARSARRQLNRKPK